MSDRGRGGRGRGTRRGRSNSRFSHRAVASAPPVQVKDLNEHERLVLIARRKQPPHTILDSITHEEQRFVRSLRREAMRTAEKESKGEVKKSVEDEEKEKHKRYSLINPNNWFSDEEVARLTQLLLVCDVNITATVVGYMSLPYGTNNVWNLIWRAIYARLDLGASTRTVLTSYQQVFIDHNVMTEGIKCMLLPIRSAPGTTVLQDFEFDDEPAGPPVAPTVVPKAIFYKIGAAIKQPRPPIKSNETKEEALIRRAESRVARKPRMRVWFCGRHLHKWHFQVESWHVVVDVPAMNITYPLGTPPWLKKKVDKVFRVGGGFDSKSWALRTSAPSAKSTPNIVDEKKNGVLPLRLSAAADEKERRPPLDVDGDEDDREGLAEHRANLREEREAIHVLDSPRRVRTGWDGHPP